MCKCDPYQPSKLNLHRVGVFLFAIRKSNSKGETSGSLSLASVKNLLNFFTDGGHR